MLGFGIWGNSSCTRPGGVRLLRVRVRASSQAGHLPPAGRGTHTVTAVTLPVITRWFCTNLSSTDSLVLIFRSSWLGLTSMSRVNTHTHIIYICMNSYTWRESRIQSGVCINLLFSSSNDCRSQDFSQFGNIVSVRFLMVEK